MARKTKTEQARPHARAIVNTCQRYFDGYMVRATWKRHMRSLWGTIDAAGLRKQVVEQVTPKLCRLVKKAEKRARCDDQR